MLAVEQLKQSAGSPGAIDAFLHDHTFPIVEGRQVTFVYRGMAHDVFLQHWVKGLAEQQRLTAAAMARTAAAGSLGHCPPACGGGGVHGGSTGGAGSTGRGRRGNTERGGRASRCAGSPNGW